MDVTNISPTSQYIIRVTPFYHETNSSLPPHRLAANLRRELPTRRSRHRKAKMDICKEPKGFILDLLHPESNSGVLSIYDESSGEGAYSKY